MSACPLNEKEEEKQAKICRLAFIFTNKKAKISNIKEPN